MLRSDPVDKPLIDVDWQILDQKNAPIPLIRPIESIPDLVIVNDFLQLSTNFDPESLFDIISAIPTLGVHDLIPKPDDSKEAFFLPGEHPALWTRFNKPMKRKKIWLQTVPILEYYLNYGYTGKRPITHQAQRHISSIPEVEALLNALNEMFGFEFNHCIVTYYLDKNSNISPHFDKVKSFAPRSIILVIKLGAERDFTINTNEKEEKDQTTIFHQKLSPGSAVFMGANYPGSANESTLHSVPKMKSPVGPSASLVFRHITEKITWAEVDKLIASSNSKYHH